MRRSLRGWRDWHINRASGKETSPPMAGETNAHLCWSESAPTFTKFSGHCPIQMKQNRSLYPHSSCFFFAKKVEMLVFIFANRAQVDKKITLRSFWNIVLS